MNIETDWRDALVELHVLAENGDLDAASEAARWLARDASARDAWDAIQHTCDTVRKHDFTRAVTSDIAHTIAAWCHS